MTACERCWSDYRMRSLFEPNLTYSEVVAQNEAARGACSPAEQCGEMHLILEWKDGGRRCRCGERVERVPSEVAKQ